jgi:hypothetical protein
MFLVAFLYLLVGSWGQRGERTTPAAEGHSSIGFTAPRTVQIGRERVARAEALEDAR